MFSFPLPCRMGSPDAKKRERKNVFLLPSHYFRVVTTARLSVVTAMLFLIFIHLHSYSSLPLKPPPPFWSGWKNLGSLTSFSAAVGNHDKWRKGTLEHTIVTD